MTKIITEIVHSGTEQTHPLNNDIYLAIIKGNTFRVGELVKQGVNINHNANYEIALHIATREGNLKMIDLLLKLGAKVDATDDFGDTVLHLATREENLKMVDLLLKLDAKTDATDDFGDTVLHLAAIDYIDIAKVLVMYKADIEAKNVMKQTALHIATREGNLKMIDLLLKLGAKTDATDDFSNTASHLAPQDKNTSVMSFLVKEAEAINQEIVYDFDQGITDFRNAMPGCEIAGECIKNI